MKPLSLIVIIFISLLLGFIAGYCLAPNEYALPQPDSIVSDTTATDTTIYTWEYKPVETKPITGELTLQSDSVTVQDSIHTIHFDVEEGSADIVYNIYDRTGELSWTPKPVRRETVIKFNEIHTKETLTVQPPVYFHRASFVGGVCVGAVAIIGLIAAVGAVL
jgi:hypothetical protein